jgi:outer membrane protein OmpA-like peptidoglycan-associated protein
MSRSLHNALGLSVLALAALSAGCAGSRSYVVLLPSPDGSVGKVTVSGPAGQQLLTRAQTGARMDGGKPPFEVSGEQLARDFGAAISSRPALPEQFLLYFSPGGAALTAESDALLTQILARAKARTSVDLSVIGHTDTKGDAKANESLGLARANTIAALLRQMGLPDVPLSVESHGERNLLVATPDETDEPRNRCVEVTLR